MEIGFEVGYLCIRDLDGILEDGPGDDLVTGRSGQAPFVPVVISVPGQHVRQSEWCHGSGVTWRKKKREVNPQDKAWLPENGLIRTGCLKTD